MTIRGSFKIYIYISSKKYRIGEETARTWKLENGGTSRLSRPKKAESRASTGETKEQPSETAGSLGTVLTCTLPRRLAITW